jgi:hypothetical protein
VIVAEKKVLLPKTRVMLIDAQASKEDSLENEIVFRFYGRRAGGGG